MTLALDLVAAREFLLLLFGDGISRETQLVLYGKKYGPRWCSSINAAMKHVRELAVVDDLWFSTCLHSPDLMREEARRRKVEPVMRRRRGYSCSAVVAPGVWIDIDHRSSGHKSDALPANAEEAAELAHWAPLEPSLVVGTGGGIHAWWLFEELMALLEHRSTARSSFARLCKGWEKLLRGEAERRGWKLDACADLARVLRLPGTPNHKYGTVVAMEPAEEVVRHDFAELERLIPDEFLIAQAPPARNERPASVRPVSGGTTFVLDPGASPPAKLFGLLEVDTDLAILWEGKAKKLKGQSEYDLGLASRLVGYDLSDQEIADSLVYHRRTSGLCETPGNEAKVNRPDYYARTIAKARQGRTASETAERLSRAQDELEAKLEGGLDPEGRPRTGDDALALRTLLTERLGLPDEAVGLRLQRLVGEPSTYFLTIPGRPSALLGSIKEVLSYRFFKAAVAEATKIVLRPELKGAAWNAVCQALMALCEDYDVGEDLSGVAAEAATWVRDYLEAEPPSDDEREAIGLRMPFVKDGAPHFFLDRLAFWVETERRAKVTGRRLALWLKASGYEPRVVAWKGSTRNTWRRAIAPIRARGDKSG